MGIVGRLFREGFLRAGTVGISVVVIQEYLGGVVVCTGPSMEPTIWTNDIILTDQVSPRLGRIKKGDVVIARSPENFGRICKRVVAESGDTVIFKENRFTIPEGHVWLEGDNKDNSHDSRNWGPLPLPLVRRRCYLKIWPHLDTLHTKKVNAPTFSQSK